MKREFFRNKRLTHDSIVPLSINIEKRVSRSNNGIMQSLINIVVYILIFVVFFKDNLHYISLFIAFMATSIIAQLIILFGKSIKRSKCFPFFRVVKDVKLYEEYLKMIDKDIDEYIEKYDRWLCSNFFSSHRLYEFVEYLSPQLFNRLPMHLDFLTVNLGQTHILYPIYLMYPTFTYNENDEILNQFKIAMERKVTDRSKTVLPFSFSLREKKSIAFVNNGISEDEFLNIINYTILDIAILQSSEEVSLCFVFDDDCDLEWTRFLPHVWFGNRRLIFCNSEPEFEFIKLFNEAIANKGKHIVAVIDVDFIKMYQFYDIFNSDFLPDNLSVVFFSQSGMLPSRAIHHVICSKREDKFLGNYEDYDLLLNTFTSEEGDNIARQLFNIRVFDNHSVISNSIPEWLTFFELFSIKSTLDVPEASIDENIAIQLHFPVKIGLGREREEIYIDLTNDGDGNHCLVTGTNGSGKSEFMLTYVLTACSKYRPDYLSFVVIDFKGGAMSSKIRNLPHCLGEFTNSSSSISSREVARIAELLESEISYRESIMREAGCANDLPKYHKLYSEGKLKVALPRLLIVVDEVAVFFAKDNTAINYITHIATVGRAVGMILLLATQSKNGIIPSQVKTNINVNVEFYSEDDNKNKRDKIKGRAMINSHIKRDCECQVALSAIYDSSLDAVDFITISAKSRIISGSERYTQFEQVYDCILRRYPNEIYAEILDEIITEPLELCIKGHLRLSTLQNLYYGDESNSKACYPIGVSDNIYIRKREAFVFTPANYNLLVFGKSQSGKTTFVKTLLVSMFHRSYGLRPDAVSIYILAKNSSEYSNYCFPQVGSILPENDIYYFLLFLVNEILERRKQIIPDKISFIPMIVIIDDCYMTIRQNDELTRMFTFITNESVKCGISVILTLSFKSGFGDSILKNFSSTVAFHMGYDFDYSSIMNLDSIKYVPNIKGRCLIDIAGNTKRTLETQIAYPFVSSEDEVDSFAKSYSDLWQGKAIPKNIPVMPSVIIGRIDKSRRSIPVGQAKDLTFVTWNLELANTYLVSYFLDNDAVAFTRYLIDIFSKMRFDIIVVDNQRNSLYEKKSAFKISYYQYNEQDKLSQYLNDFRDMKVCSTAGTVLIMFDFVRCLFPAMQEEKELIKIIDELIRSNKLYGVFIDLKDFLNAARNSSTRFGQYLEGVNSGLLIGNSPSNHTFGFSGLSANEQIRPLDIGWGVNVSPSSSEIKRIKIATEVEK